MSSAAITPRTPPRMTRNELTEMLLGREIEIKFVSIHEALSIHYAEVVRGGWPDHRVRDLVALEEALHVPIYLAIDGVVDPHALAKGLADAINRIRPFVCANEGAANLLAAHLRRRNGAANWIELAAGLGS